MRLDCIGGRGVAKAGLAAAGLALAALAPAAAMAKADLIIVKEDSTVNFGSCAESAPLASGRIVIRNDGATRATMRLGALTRFTRSILTVYEPEHPDMVDKGKERTALDPKDQASIDFRLGDGVVKKGRFASAQTSEALLDLASLKVDDKKELQEALKALGHYRGPIDGLLGGGYRSAVSAFQERLGDENTGVLTVAETVELSRKSGKPLTLGASESGSAETTRIPVMIYAVVDPYNLVDESNEANNIAKFSGEITCD